MTAVSMVSKLSAAGALLLAAAILPGTASAASDITGVWLNDTGRGAIEIKPCGGNLCGHVVWVKDGSDAKGCGRQIIGDAQPVKAGVWDNGWIYSPERKKRYDVELKPIDDDRLKVTGYAGSKFFSKSMVWKRAPADLVRCGTETASLPEDIKPDAQASESTKAAPAAVEAATPAEPDRRSPQAKMRDALAKEAADAAAPSKSAEADESSSENTETADAGDLGLGGMKLDKYLKRENGKCALDLPWVKVNFKCEE